MKGKQMQTIKALIFCTVTWKKLSRRWGIRRLKDDNDIPGNGLRLSEKDFVKDNGTAGRKQI